MTHKTKSLGDDEQKVFQLIQKGNKKAAILFFDLFALKEKTAEVREEDFKVDLNSLEDDVLIGLHQNTTWEAPSYFLRRRFFTQLNQVDDKKLMVLVQAQSKKAKKEFMDRYKLNLEAAPDESLVLLAQNGDDLALDVLVERYYSYVKKIIQKLDRKYFFRGLDQSDLIQEGIMGLFKSKNDFKIERKTRFQDFSKHVIEKHMGTLILKSANYKNRVLNESFSYHSPIGNDSDITFEQMLKSDNFKPENTCINKETLEAIEEKLTDLEKEVLEYYAKGLSYKEIGELVGKKKKAIDNTIQRIRKKGQSYISNFI